MKKIENTIEWSNNYQSWRSRRGREMRWFSKGIGRVGFCQVTINQTQKLTHLEFIKVPHNLVEIPNRDWWWVTAVLNQYNPKKLRRKNQNNWMSAGCRLRTISWKDNLNAKRRNRRERQKSLQRNSKDSIKNWRNTKRRRKYVSNKSNNCRNSKQMSKFQLKMHRKSIRTWVAKSSRVKSQLKKILTLSRWRK